MRLHDRVEVELVDLSCFGRRTGLVWAKQRWRCPKSMCRVMTFVETDDRIAAERAAITDRAGRWVTLQVGHHSRAVSEVAKDLGCDWQTVVDAVVHHGRALIDNPDRIGATTAIGLDKVLFCRLGRFRHRVWSTQVVGVARGQLLDVVAGRDAAAGGAWFAERPARLVRTHRAGDARSVGPYRAAFDSMLPHAVQIADPFHVVKLLNFVLDETRRRVQNDTVGHWGRKTDPLYRIRKLMTIAHERRDDEADAKLRSLLAASDPRGDVRMAWHAKEVCGRSTRSAIRTSPSTSSPRSASISKTTPVRPRCNGSGGPSPGDRIRSLRGIELGSRTGQPKPSTTWSSG